MEQISGSPDSTYCLKRWKPYEENRKQRDPIQALDALN